MPVETGDAFQKELIDVFVQEAQEWLQQIHVALDELQQAPPPDRHRALAHTIKAGLTNLGGTAATINLDDVERVSFSVLPLVEAIEDPHTPISAGAFLVLCKQLGQIHTALTRATGVTFDEQRDSSIVEPAPVTISTKDLLALLRHFSEQCSNPDPHRRNLIATLLTQVEGLRQGDVEACSLLSLQDFLERSAAEEEGFLQAISQHLPSLTHDLHALTVSTEQAEQLFERLPTTLDGVSQLWSAAQQVNATIATMFFMGLHGFLTVVIQQRVAIASQRYEAVLSRLHDCMRSVDAWVEHGRSERTAIREALSL